MAEVGSVELADVWRKQRRKQRSWQWQGALEDRPEKAEAKAEQKEEKAERKEERATDGGATDLAWIPPGEMCAGSAAGADGPMRRNASSTQSARKGDACMFMHNREKDRRVLQRRRRD